MKKQIISIMVVLMFVITAIPTLAGAASSQGKFFSDSFKANIGSVYQKNSSTEDQVLRFHYVSGAKYSAVSSNPNVIKVTSVKTGYDESMYDYNGRVFITGVSSGYSNITLKETVNNKTKVVGTIKVTVTGVNISATNNYNHEFGLGQQNSGVFFVNRSANATYSFKTNKEGLKVYTEQKEDGTLSIEMNATSYGQYVVSAYETLNGKTKKIKDITFNIKKMIIPDVINPEYDYASFGNYVKFMDFNYEYGFNIKGLDIFEKSGSASTDFLNRDENSTKTYEDFKVFNVSNVTDGRVGYLKSNVGKATVKADVYRINKDYKEGDKAEYVKTVTVNFK